MQIKNKLVTSIAALILAGGIAFADTASEASALVNQIGRSILTSNHLPYAEFVITDVPDTFDDYFIKANTWKKVEIYNWGLKFAHDKGELTAIVAHQIGKISNNMPSQAREQSKTNTLQITDRLSYESKHIYSHEKLNKDKVDLAADRTAIDFMIQNGDNPLAFLSIYGAYLDYDEEDATKHIMNVYDYINYNFPDKLKTGYPTESYKKAMKVVNQQLAARTAADNQKVLQEQAKIKAKKIKQANSAFKALNPWNSSYTTLQLHR